MSKRSTTCSACYGSRGLTLIEVIAAIAILGTVLSAIVLAQSRHTRQLTRARAQLEAVQAADRLIADWWIDIDRFPIGAEGSVPDNDRLRWETRLVTNDPIEELGGRVVRIEVHDQSNDPMRKAEDGGALVVVDLVLPDPAVEARELERRQTRQNPSGRTRQGQGVGGV